MHADLSICPSSSPTFLPIRDRTRGAARRLVRTVRPPQPRVGRTDRQRAGRRGRASPPSPAESLCTLHFRSRECSFIASPICQRLRPTCYRLCVHSWSMCSRGCNLERVLEVAAPCAEPCVRGCSPTRQRLPPHVQARRFLAEPAVAHDQELCVLAVNGGRLQVLRAMQHLDVFATGCSHTCHRMQALAGRAEQAVAVFVQVATTIRSMQLYLRAAPAELQL